MVPCVKDNHPLGTQKDSFSGFREEQARVSRQGNTVHKITLSRKNYKIPLKKCHEYNVYYLEVLVSSLQVRYGNTLNLVLKMKKICGTVCMLTLFLIKSSLRESRMS